MTKTFEFEIQNCIKVLVYAETKEEARDNLVNNTLEFKDEMLGPSCWISNGVEVDDN